VFGQVDLSAPIITSTTNVFAPSVSITFSVSPAIIATTTSVYAPSERLQVGPTIIATSTAVFTPTVTLSLNVSPAIIVSTTSVFQPFADDGSAPPEPPSQYNPTGGGGPAVFRSKRYRSDLRRTIVNAAKSLSEASSARAKKRKVKKFVQQIFDQVEAFDLSLNDLKFVSEHVPEDYSSLIEAQLKLLQLVEEMQRAKEIGLARANELQALMEEYQREEEALERREEEERLRLEAQARRRKEDEDVIMLLAELSAIYDPKPVVEPAPRPRVKPKPQKKPEAAPKPASKKTFRKIEFTRDENGVINGVKIGD